MLPVLRESLIKPVHYQLNDKVQFQLGETTYTATAIHEEADGSMLFVFDSCLPKDKYINFKCFNLKPNFSWEDSSLRRYLQQLVLSFPTKMKNQLVPFENGDYLRLPTKDEVDIDSPSTCFDYFKDWGRRKKYKQDFRNTSWWLMTKVERHQSWMAKNGTYFYYVNYAGGLSDGDICDTRNSVVPMFKLKNK